MNCLLRLRKLRIHTLTRITAMERTDGPQSPIPPDDDNDDPAKLFRERRQQALNMHECDAHMAGASLDSLLAYLTNDLFRYLAEARELLDQVKAQTPDPMDQMKLLFAALLEINKTSREIRSLSDLTARL